VLATQARTNLDRYHAEGEALAAKLEAAHEAFTPTSQNRSVQESPRRCSPELCCDRRQLLLPVDDNYSCRS